MTKLHLLYRFIPAELYNTWHISTVKCKYENNKQPVILMQVVHSACHNIAATCMQEILVGGTLTPPDAATKWRRPEALHCAIPGTYIASTHSQSNARILELFFHDNVTYQWLLTWLQRPAKMYLPNICRIRKNCFKNWRALRSQARRHDRSGSLLRSSQRSCRAGGACA